MACPNTINSLVTTIKTSGDFTFYKNLSVNVNGSTSKAYYLTIYDSADVTGAIDAQIFYGEENNNDITFSQYLSILVNGSTYYTPVYTGNAGADCCSDLVGDLVSGDATFNGYALVYVNGSDKRFIRLYDMVVESGSTSSSSAIIGSESSASSPSSNSSSSISSASSLSSNSSSSISSASSISSNSSSSISSISSISSESSSTSYGYCDSIVDGTGFASSEFNVQYILTGEYNDRPYWFSGTYYLWWNGGAWCITTVLGDMPPLRYATTDKPCPYGDGCLQYLNDDTPDGYICQEMSNSSSSSRTR